ncbi:bifunctional phosphatase PAP2/diacylglycerol kinase family protein [Actinophytocola algeriensis]|uniref:Undecaprenyl-diphosphatase n=1 Tax=Actinophytocola algeriensis TaxID=1768010 RepID=A0A7W7QBK2_9PSEU|nr:phosphatase PAP2 family protein [Actinophytocola algeriensis]MBB4910626.1 undecaprenyl-diphosphatase [Actinophytocola algeriensis]MBE1480386.1 undecaprenyl-diphosphatase [Actinophytocola algeriensis]
MSRFDAELVRRSGDLPHTPADRGFQLLGRAANRSKLWFAIAALLIGKKGATRRAGLRGVAAIGIASFAASAVGKRLFPRRRPAAELLPVYRRMTKRPTSSSFPSGHSASAFAFASAAAMEHRGAAAVTLPLAAAVGYSRVHTGVHWPTDVAAGAAIGVGAAYATRHWWPHRKDLPEGPQRRATAEELGDGEGLVLVVNPGAGSSGDAGDEVRKAWPRADVIEILPDTDVLAELTKKVGNGTDSGPVRAIGAVGGDGTVACVAGVAVEHGLPLVLVPAGTLDHFARDLGIQNLDEAQAASRAGSVVVCDVAEVDVSYRGDETERVVYVNTASLGGYPETVRLREKLEARWPKWTAVLLATTRTLRRAKPMKIMLNGHERLVWMLFVGNGPYEPKGFGAARRPSLATGKLDVRYLRADLPYSRARFLLASLTGTLSTSHVYRHAEVARVDVVLLDGHRRIALDGEVGPLGRRFSFQVRERALPVYSP